jgi:hypothetical protein
MNKKYVSRDMEIMFPDHFTKKIFLEQLH